SIFALVGFEKDARMGQPARRGVAASDQAFQPAAILPGQAHGVVSLPGHRDASSCSLPRSHPDERARRHDTGEGVLSQTNHVRTLGHLTMRMGITTATVTHQSKSIRNKGDFLPRKPGYQIDQAT